MRRAYLLIGALALAGLIFGAVACNDDDKDNNGGDTTPAATSAATSEATAVETAVSGTPGAGASTVNVKLTEYTVSPDPESVPAGSVTFNAKNIGGVDHELVIVKTDLAEHELPTSADGSVDETGAGIEVIDEIEEFPSETEESLTVDLAAGNYVLLCNIVEDADGVTTSHYAEDMHTAFQVTE